MRDKMAKKQRHSRLRCADRDYDIMARSTLRTFIATMGGTIQEEYMLIMDGFREEYAELVQFLKDECVFVLVPQAPKKEYEIEVAGDAYSAENHYCRRG